MRDGNWIDGRREPAAEGGLFESALRSGGGHRREPWPRSDGADLEWALGSLGSAGPSWRGLSARDRRACLLDRLDAWQRRAPGVDELAERLGLGHDALDDELELALHAGDRILDGGGGRGESGTVLVRVPASELWERALAEVLRPLLAGASVLVLSDPDLPWVMDELLRALVEPDPEHPLASAVALLHGDRPGLVQEALRGGGLSRAWLGGLEVEAHGTPVQGHGPRGASEVVLRGEDPAERAVEVLEAAFGPARALGGQRAGHTARVFCHERHLSGFTDALLVGLDAAPREGRCRPFVSDLGRRCGALVRLGLDEGATLLRSGPEGRSGFRGGSRDASLWPSVFTNVEPQLTLARATEPAPVLSLVRAADDDTAQALAGRADDR